MLVYNIGVSAIRANQIALQTVANNLANASVEGYHRQRVNLVPSNPINDGRLQYGTGVQVAQVERLRSSAVENALSLNLSQNAEASSGLAALEEIERLLTPSDTSLHAKVSEFFNQLEQLGARPGDDTIRRAVIGSAQAIAGEITSVNQGLDQLQRDIAQELQRSVDRVNELSGALSDLNTQIRTARAGGIEPATLLDQKDRIIQELSSLVDLSPSSLATDSGPLVAAGGWMAIGERAPALSLRQGADGKLEIMMGSNTGPVIPASGGIAGLLTAHNQWVGETQDAFLEWTSAFVSGVDSLQATGLGLNGPVDSVLGTRSVADPNRPLAEADPLFPVSAGSLFVSVTNLASGTRTTHRVEIDPAVDSLADVMARIDSLDGVTAGLQAGSGQAMIVAESGFAIDFAGRPNSTINDSGISGASRPALQGTYQGAGNPNWRFTALSGGEVGVTEGLTIRVTDALSGETIADLNVGAGYAAGAPIPVSDGISISFAAGDLALNDEFSLQLVGNADSAGFLTAMGVGSFFQTTDLKNLSVQKSLTNDPRLLAASRTGEPADAGQISRWIEFRDARLLSGGTETIEARLASMTSASGLSVQSKRAESSQLQVQLTQLRSQQDAISGVDPNEELLLMLEFQRAFQANAKFISTVNDALDQLLGLVG